MNNEQIRKVIGQKVKYYRQIRSLTQRELADELAVNYSYIANIEQGQKGVSLEKIVEFCDFFNISVSDLLPLEMKSEIDEKEYIIEKIADSLRTWEIERVQLVESMVIGER